MTAASGTVAGAVDRRKAQGKPVADQAIEAQEWFGRIAASHVNPDAFVQLSLAQLGRVKHLREAANANPPAFLAAMAECARWGLMPGQTGFYLPFKDNKNPENHGWSITFVKHWTGEVELMYRPGGVEAVVIQEIRAHDEFAWDPRAMRVPEHSILPNEHGQAGLAGDEDRGPLTGAYCYLRYKGGGTSYPTVMSKREIKKHYDKSRAGKEFWGDWTGKTLVEGPWSADMFRKTAAKKHRGAVPTSPEFLASIEQAAAQVLTPPPGITVGPPVAEDLEPGEMPAALLPGNGNGHPAPGTIAGQVESAHADKPLTKGDALNRITELVNGAELHGPQWSRVRLALIGFLAAGEATTPVELGRLSDLTVQQARDTVSVIETVLAAYPDRRARDILLGLALERGAWDGQDPPPPPGWAAQDGHQADPGPAEPMPNGDE